MNEKWIPLSPDQTPEIIKKVDSEWFEGWEVLVENKDGD